MKTLLSVAALLLVSAGAGLADEFPTCEKVPTPDVEAAFGIKVVKTKSLRTECVWYTSQPAILVRAVIFEKGTASVVRSDGPKYVADMKKTGVTVTVTDDKPDLWCHQDSGLPKIGLPPTAACEAFVGRYRVSLDGVGEPMTTKQVKALIEKMNARLK